MDMPTVEEAAQSIREGRTSAVELVERSLAAIEARDELNAFVYVDPAGALESAAQVDRCVARGEPLGPLAGVPFGVKDVTLPDARHPVARRAIGDLHFHRRAARQAHCHRSRFGLAPHHFPKPARGMNRRANGCNHLAASLRGTGRAGP
jgi:hypothetical protein